MATLGEKIRFFRKRAGLSQMELEIRINASQGSISRIEKDLINPTKETILKIAKIFNLHSTELEDLFNIEAPLPEEKDYKRVKDFIKDYFSRDDVFALLLDWKWDIIDASDGLIILLGLKKEQKEKILPINFFEIRLSNNLEFKENNFTEYLIHDLAFYRKFLKGEQRKRYLNDLVGKLSKYPVFKDCWDKSFDIIDPYLNMKTREVFLNIKGKENIVYPSYRFLSIDSRFEIVEYYLEFPVKIDRNLKF